MDMNLPTEPMDADALLHAAQAHRTAAERLVLDLRLVDQWQEYGEVELTGSYRWGLMLGSDIDITVVNPSCDLGMALEALNRFIRHGRFLSFGFIDSVRGKPKWADPQTYPEGYYLGMAGEFEGREWKIETWLLCVPPPQDRILEQLSAQNRITILRLKQMRNTGTFKAASYDIYRAVLLGGAQDPASVEKWLAQEKASKT